jgi:hypothetical protein
MTQYPVTTQIQCILTRHGLAPERHQRLISDLMRYVYDEKEKAVDEVLGEPFDAKITAFAERVDQAQNGIREDLHGICLDNQRAKEDTNA